MSFGLTLDTGALIAIERRRQRMARIAETLLRGLRIEIVDAELGKVAGEALATIQGATAIDAIVMASAARRGDVVYTSDVDDLERLREYFPGVRVLGV